MRLRFTTSLLALAAIMELTAAVAMAATITGDDNPNNDTITGGDGRNRIGGGAGNDLISGGSGDDVSHGGDGNDRIYANVGVDESFGDAGNDDLWALARADVTPGPGGEVDQVGDTLHGGAGDDTFHTRDGEVDKIDCGDGNDVALLDTVDVIIDATAANPNGSCEKVVRKAHRVGGQNKVDKTEDNADNEATRGDRLTPS